MFSPLPIETRAKSPTTVTYATGEPDKKNIYVFEEAYNTSTQRERKK